MTPEEKRIKIAECCGWRWNIKQGDGLWWVFCPRGTGAGMTTEITPDYFFSVFKVPDYLTSLDAIAQAEATLKLDERDPYWQHLARITEKGRMATAAWLTMTATATQRADAFLKVKGIL